MVINSIRRRLAPGALKIATWYLLVSILWIVLSTSLAHYLVTDPMWTSSIEIIKGWFFIILTTSLLYKLLAKTERETQKQNEETAATYEELLAAEEELRQQLDELLNKEAKISRRNECLYALHEAALSLMQERTIDEVLATIVRKMKAIGGSQFGYIYLLDEADNVMRAKIIEGFPEDQVKTTVKRGKGIIGTVWETGKILVINNYHEWEGRLREPIYSTIRTGIGVPLASGGQVIGVFSMNYTWDHIVDAEELQMLDSFAELASIALENSHLHEALQKSQSRTKALIDALPDSIFQFNSKGILLSYKRGKDSDLLYDIKVKVGQKIEKFLPPETAQKFMENLNKALQTGTTQLFEYDFMRQDMAKCLETRILASGENEVIAIVRDITQRKEMESQLQYIGLHDRVTGLYNRVYFEEELRRLDEHPQIPVGIIVFDIDGLKLVNDTLGHQAGDELLFNAGKIISSCFDAGEEVARIGGDEFAVILPGKDITDAEQACHSIREKLDQYRTATIPTPLSISIGMSVRTSLEQRMSDVFKVADNNMYREKLHSSHSARSAIVQTLAKALEERDFATDGHADRLQDLIVDLGLAVGLPESALPDLRLLGRFHDIGKVGIPDHILFKPGRLTADEYQVMQRHSEIGYRIAQSSAELAPIADWILKHQEWWNGKGYPLGLKGEAIPLPSRLLAVVDAYDAMTNDRPYRKAMTHEQAIAELERCAGTQFAPDLVGTFAQIVKSHRI